MEKSRDRIAAVVEALFLLAVLAAVFIYSFRPNWDIDIFWHVAAGSWITDNGAVPHTDIFSATDPSRPWTTFQWLYEVIVYEIQARAGFAWIRLLHAGLFVATFALWWRWFRRAVPGRIAAATLLMLALVLSGDRFRVRPEVFNFFFAALTLPALFGWDDRGGRPRARTLALVALVAGLWANIHAGGALWLPLAAGAIVAGRLVGWLADRSLADSRARLKGGALLLAAATLPMLPMPGFLKGVTTAFTMYEGSMVLIPEWHPPAAYFLPAMAGALSPHHVVCGLVPYLLMAVIAALLIAGLLRHRWRGYVQRTDPGLLAFASLMALMAANTSRFIYLDALAVAAIALAYRERLAALVAPRGAKVGLLIVAMVLGGISFEKSILRDRQGLGRALSLLSVDLEPNTFPEAASDTISAMGLKGRILHLTSWGGYLIGRHWPDCTVFSDGRGNFTADEREVIVQTHKPYEREQALEEAWHKFPFDIVVFPAPVFPLLTWDRTRWTLIHRDDMVEVFLRVSPENAENLARARAWWRAIGIDVPEDVGGAEKRYLRVLTEEYLRRPRVDAALVTASTQAKSDDPRTAATGLFDGAMILFESGRYPAAARFFRKALDQGFRHSTCGLYLAWSLFLDGDAAGAREALATYLGSPEVQAQRDYGPLKFGGRRILEMLASRLGLTAIAAPAAPAP